MEEANPFPIERRERLNAPRFDDSIHRLNAQHYGGRNDSGRSSLEQKLGRPAVGRKNTNAEAGGDTAPEANEREEKGTSRKKEENKAEDLVQAKEELKMRLERVRSENLEMQQHNDLLRGHIAGFMARTQSNSGGQYDH